jgi:hypothetical protein
MNDRMEVACAFCGADVAYSESDPTALDVIEAWRPWLDQVASTLYCHRQCLRQRLDPEVRAVFDIG